MTLLINICLFLSGMYVSQRMIVALYGIIDFWYTIKTAYQKVMSAVLWWSGLTILIILLLGNEWRGAFLLGFGAFFILYPAVFWIHDHLFDEFI